MIKVSKAVIGDECDQVCCQDICEECEELLDDCECDESEEEIHITRKRIARVIKYPKTALDTQLSVL